eukprot:3712394-Alexandrium_andersonii.AAC.1
MQHSLPAFAAVQASLARRILGAAGRARPAPPHIVASDFVRLPGSALVAATATLLGVPPQGR